MAARPFAVVSLSLILSTLPARLPAQGADGDLREWLMRMTDAVENMNYRGTLVHVNDSTAGVLDIVHRVDDGMISERITALDGMQREILRNNDEVTCILPDKKVVLVEQRDDHDPAKSPLRGRLPSSSGVDDSHYRLESSGSGRAAGRPAKIISVQPRDDYRYGYRLWLDKASAMPLKSQLLDERGRVIEEILFASIAMPESISPAAVRPSLDTRNFDWQHSGDPDEAGEAASASGWRALDLPVGFELIAANSKMPPGSRHAMEHLVYADGLASVSVFIEAGVAASEQAEGLSRIGAANAYTTTRDGQLVTAVGEVPARTVEMIALSVRHGVGP